jgi:putative ABC transport system ATP-binding protein
LELFNEINKEGTTIVIVTHDPGIGASTKRCIKILDGKIAEDKINQNVISSHSGKNEENSEVKNV